MIVDSSVWIEIFRDGPLRQKCERALQHQRIRVPSLVIFEVYRKLKVKSSEDIALSAVAFLSRHDVLDLTRDISLLAADLSLQHGLSMADSIVLAHAKGCDEVLLTLDNDFASIPQVKVTH